MKTDIDTLMQLNDIEALLVTGPARHNAPMYYFTGGVHLGQADLLKLRGQAPVLFYNSMERDEAARTGLATKSLDDAKGELLTKVYDDPKFEVETLVRLGESFYAVGAAEIMKSQPAKDKPVTNEKLQQARWIFQRING
jgi:uncharacterized protein (DUF1501 family)